MGCSRLLVGSAVLLTAFAGAAGCGGSSVKHVGAGEAGEGTGDKGATGGSNTTGGTSGTAGTTGGTSGTSATGGTTGGTSGTSGTSATGGTTGGTAAGGSSTTGGATMGGTSGAGGCGPIPPCDPVDCPGNDYAEPTCGGCPVCCALVDCAAADCQNDEVAVRLPGNCCDTCMPAATLQGCENVMCKGPAACDPDSTWRRAEGACCESCVPLEAPSCVDIACPDLECARGFAPGNGVNGCCYECVPDPLFCNRNSDCTLAVHVGDDCACQGAISWREFNDDVCWESKDSGRTAPASCGESGACPCPYGGNYAVCNDNSQCQQITVSLK